MVQSPSEVFLGFQLIHVVTGQCVNCWSSLHSMFPVISIKTHFVYKREPVGLRFIRKIKINLLDFLGCPPVNSTIQATAFSVIHFVSSADRFHSEATGCVFSPVLVL